MIRLLFSILLMTSTANAGLVNHWKLDETSGTTADDAVGNDDCSYVNTPSQSTDVAPIYETNVRSIGTANADNDYLDCGAGIGIDWTDSDWTWTAWAKMTSDVGGGIAIMSNRNVSVPWITLGYYGGELAIEHGSGTIATFGALPVNVWRHYAVVKSGTTVSIYVDRIYVGQVTISDIGDATNGFYIGMWFSGVQCWEGNIDDVKIYNEAITQDEINNVYSGPNRLEGGFTLNNASIN